ncbi:MAG: gluconokinase [Chitinophagaceae bacterium]|nr:gluconokinase [Chitinophagaceae bacterium]MCW5927673.1 gluconokinase [Chitinophagaceae bacterium]
MKLVIGVDIGTTNIKVLAFSADRKVLFRREEACVTIQTSPEFSEQDPNTVLQSVTRLLKEAFSELRTEDILAVSFSAAMHSIIATDARGNHLTNAILWGDTRSYKEEEELKKSGLADRLYQETGVPVHPSLPVCKIKWLEKNQPAIFKKAAKFISLKEYLFFRLFGVYIVDYAIAASSGMQNIHTLQWSSLALETAGIQADRLSEIVPPTHFETQLTDFYKKSLGLTTGLPFVIGSSDGCLANIGTGVLDDSRAALTIGTSGAIRTTLRQPHLNSTPSLFCYPLTRDIYIKGGAINNGAFTLQWLLQDILKEKPSGEVYDRILGEVAHVPAGSDGLIFLPYLKGERAPIWNALARGAFIGLNSMHEQKHLVRSVLEGIGFSLYDVFCEMAESEKSITEIYASGGFIKSGIWVQIIADIFDKQVVVTDAADASAIGAAYFGFQACGIMNHPREMLSDLKAEKVYYPDKKNHDVYMQRFLKFRSAYRALVKEFE